MSEPIELLFFDTFAHDNTEEINLDLVQFTKPVYVTEVRIIPLGARVHADFPGGVRLGATNPSQFQIEFFVNDLGKPGASTFESLGGFEYNQNDCINLNCAADESARKIPTDGLVLRGWYTTITLAVYGTLTNNISEQIIQPVVNPSLPTQPNTIADAQQIISGNTIENDWNQETITNVPIEYSQNTTAPYQPTYNPPAEGYGQEYNEYYNDVPKDPRNYHHTPETDWDSKIRPRTSEGDRDRDRDRDRVRDINYQKTGSTERDHGRSDPDRRDRERDRDKNYVRSHSRDRERPSREYRDVSRERDWDHDRPEYRDRDRDRDRDWDRDRNRDRDRDRRHDDSYRRPYNRDERDDRKRPRTPPIQVSPKRPHTPHGDRKEPSPPETENFSEEEIAAEKQRREEKPTETIQKSPVKEVREVTPPTQEETTQQQMDVEEFEPILSDEDILDEEIDYDYGTYTNNEDIIKLFIPGVTQLRKFETQSRFKIQKDSIEIDENLKTTIGIVDDYFKSSITKYSLEEFDKLNTEIKEEFIHLSEKLMPIFQSVEHFCDIVKMYDLSKNLNLNCFNNNDKELLEQVKMIIETLYDWLKIALNYEMANVQTQPAYKIRHIKCGVKLAEFCCNSVEFIKLLWENNFNIQNILLNLYDQEYMALSIKLMIIKTLDTYLLHKYAIEKFLTDNHHQTSNKCKENGFHDKLIISKDNGYKVLVEKLLKNPSVRLKFAINSILKKLNLYEISYKAHMLIVKLRNNEISNDEINLIIEFVNQILNTCNNGQFVLSQPKRFLPVSAQFEIVRSETKNVLIEYFKMFDLLQCFLILLTSTSTYNLPSIKTPILEILSELLKTPEGLCYLTENIEAVNVLLRCLLKSEEELQYSMQNYLNIRSHNLGLEIAYKIETLYYIETLIELGKKLQDYDSFEIIDNLHGLFCLTFTYKGKICCAEILGMKDNIKCLLQFLGDLNLRDKSEYVVNKFKKSASIGYIIDLIAFTVSIVPNIQLIENYYKQLNQIVEHIEIFDETLHGKINEIKYYISPIMENGNLCYDNISNFVEIINKNIDNVTSFPGQLITSLWTIHYLGVSPYSSNSSILIENSLSNYIELKYKHVILQLFSLDGMAVIIKVLQKLCEHYDQPHLHTSTFVSNNGLLIMNIISPCLELLKQMLTYVIQCRNTNFKDLTAIPILLQTYNLLNSFPNTSGVYLEAQECCKKIIDTLLVYTQPLSNEIHEKDSLNKTLWTLMIGEIIKYTTSLPYTFISGLLIFSELLPLPLPIQTKQNLTKDEIMWVVNLRRLWSAHLHPHNTNIQELIEKLCTTNHPQLLNLLRRVCVQLADLAANSALMIAKGILDIIYKNLVPNDETKITICTNHISRLLNFLACLMTHNTLKCAVLHLIHSSNSKSSEKYSVIIQIFGTILKTNNDSTSHIQSQECILSIIQSFCDIEVTLLQNSWDSNELTSDIYLANALPMKDYLISFITMILDHFSIENSFVTYLPAVRTLLLLTEHDYGFYHLYDLLIKRNDLFMTVLKKLVNNFSKDNAECLSTLNTLAEFIRVCVSTDDVEPNLLYTPRKMKMNLNDIKTLIGWKEEMNEAESDDVHPLFKLEEIIKKLVTENISFESLLEGITSVLKLLRTTTGDSKEVYTEPILPDPEALLVQFSGRTVFSSADICDERLTIGYWLSPSNDESESENITCDLNDVVRQYLPSDLSIIREIEKLCRINPLDTSDEKEKNEIDQKIKTKKLFVTPMRSRGFPRTIPQRGDLFRSRPPNTSRPPSLHVDDFVALETCGAQPTGPTGYNKFSRELLASNRIARGSRGRAFVTSERSWWGPNVMRSPYQ